MYYNFFCVFTIGCRNWNEKGRKLYFLSIEILTMSFCLIQNYIKSIKFHYVSQLPTNKTNSIRTFERRKILCRYVSSRKYDHNSNVSFSIITSVFSKYLFQLLHLFPSHFPPSQEISQVWLCPFRAITKRHRKTSELRLNLFPYLFIEQLEAAATRSKWSVYSHILWHL